MHLNTAREQLLKSSYASCRADGSSSIRTLDNSFFSLSLHPIDYACESEDSASTTMQHVALHDDHELQSVLNCTGSVASSTGRQVRSNTLAGSHEHDIGVFLMEDYICESLTSTSRFNGAVDYNTSSWHTSRFQEETSTYECSVDSTSELLLTEFCNNGSFNTTPSLSSISSFSSVSTSPDNDDCCDILAPLHVGSEKAVCADCQENCGTFQKLQKHSKRENHHPFLCTYPMCGRRFTRRDTFLRHRASHSKLPQFMCELCCERGEFRWFQRKDHLTQHKRKIHSRKDATGTEEPVLLLDCEKDEVVRSASSERMKFKEMAQSIRAVLPDAKDLDLFDSRIDTMEPDEVRELSVNVAKYLRQYTAK